MTKYNELSDFEINKRVAAINFENDAKLSDNPSTNIYGKLTGVGQTVKAAIDDGCGVTAYHYKDYCNNPADAWPIIELMFESNVTLVMNSHGVMTNNLGLKFNGKSFDVECKPLRAAMTVFLMMNEKGGVL